MIKYLVEKGADVNFKNKNGNTPLIVACKVSNISIVKFLIDHGSNVNDIEERSGDTPFYC